MKPTFSLQYNSLKQQEVKVQKIYIPSNAIEVKEQKSKILFWIFSFYTNMLVLGYCTLEIKEAVLIRTHILRFKSPNS